MHVIQLGEFHGYFIARGRYFPVYLHMHSGTWKKYKEEGKWLSFYDLAALESFFKA